MKRPLALFFVILLLSSLLGCSGGGSKDALLSSLTSEPVVTALAQQVGVTSEQAIGGLGAILALARNKVSPAEFSTLTAGIPSAEKYIDAADGMGVNTGEVRDMIQLKDAYKKVGMGEQAVSDFSPAAVNYVRTSGGEAAAAILSGLGL
jgi:ABC-type proline/glycine betaine transport system permease subunit